MELADESKECLEQHEGFLRLPLFGDFCNPMVLDLGLDNMAGCSSEEDLPDCDCDVNRQDRLENLC